MSERVVDARGLRCPLPVIELARAVGAQPTATRVLVLATDPAAAHDIPAWCRMCGHVLAEVRQAGDHAVYVVEVTPSRRAEGPRARPRGAPGTPAE